MKLNKKVVESMTVTSAMLVMTTITAFGGSTEDSKSGLTETVVLSKGGRAGIISELCDKEMDRLNESGMITASIGRGQRDIVSKSQADAAETEDAAGSAAGVGEFAAEAAAQSVETDAAEVTADVPAVEEIVEEEAPEQSLEESKWQNLVMANVEEDMNIRTAPDESAELAGKFYRGDVAEVVSVEGEWTQISSGNVTGYVKNDYLVYGMEASELANEVCSIYATVNTDGLKVDKDAAADEGWVAVHTSDATAYVSAEYVGVELNLGTALNSEEVAAKEAEEAEEKAAESAKKPAASANADEVTLLGALIQCEAGNGSYEGMVAVGAVVMNRVRSGAYPGSISGVIYQGGQFPPALNGSVANVMANGVRSACLQAAREAISGVDNTNGAVSFRSAASGYAGTVIGANVFF